MAPPDRPHPRKNCFIWNWSLIPRRSEALQSYTPLYQLRIVVAIEECNQLSNLRVLKKKRMDISFGKFQSKFNTFHFRPSLPQYHYCKSITRVCLCVVFHVCFQYLTCEVLIYFNLTSNFRGKGCKVSRYSISNSGNSSKPLVQFNQCICFYFSFL